MKLEITSEAEIRTWGYVTASAYHQTDSLRDGLKENLRYTFEYEIDDDDVDYFDELSLTASIGKYEFDIDTLEYYSDTAKDFLEDIMKNDDEKGLEKFYRLTQSGNAYLLEQDWAHLESIFGYEDFETRVFS